MGGQVSPHNPFSAVHVGGAMNQHFKTKPRQSAPGSSDIVSDRLSAHRVGRLAGFCIAQEVSSPVRHSILILRRRML